MLRVEGGTGRAHPRRACCRSTACCPRSTTSDTGTPATPEPIQGDERHAQLMQCSLLQRRQRAGWPIALVLAGSSWPAWRQARRLAAVPRPQPGRHLRETGLLKSWPAGGPRVLWKVPVGAGLLGDRGRRRPPLHHLGKGDDEVAVGARRRHRQAALARPPRPQASRTARATARARRRPWTAAWSTCSAPRASSAALKAANGKAAWSTTCAPSTARGCREWGVSTSPLVEGNLLLVDVGGSARQVARRPSTRRPARWSGPRRATGRLLGAHRRHRRAACARCCSSPARSLISVSPRRRQAASGGCPGGPTTTSTPRRRSSCRPTRSSSPPATTPARPCSGSRRRGGKVAVEEVWRSRGDEEPVQLLGAPTTATSTASTTRRSSASSAATGEESVEAARLRPRLADPGRRPLWSCSPSAASWCSSRRRRAATGRRRAPRCSRASAGPRRRSPATALPAQRGASSWPSTWRADGEAAGDATGTLKKHRDSPSASSRCAGARRRVARPSPTPAPRATPAMTQTRGRHRRRGRLPYVPTSNTIVTKLPLPLLEHAGERRRRRRPAARRAGGVGARRRAAQRQRRQRPDPERRGRLLPGARLRLARRAAWC